MTRCLTIKKKTMKTFNLFVIAILMLTSCSSIQVASDYDEKVDLATYKTYAFYKPGIDKLEMSDLDKKRLLRAIDSELQVKGYVKSSNPDFMINVFTKTKEKINVYSTNFYGYGYYGWNPMWWGPNAFNDINVNQYTEGTIFIDFIDVEKRELFWQGIGSGTVSNMTGEKKEKLLNKFVNRIMNQYPNAVTN